MTTSARQTLQELYLQHSKHASYQLVHPILAPYLPDAMGLPAGKLELERQAYFDRCLPLLGARVLDIGTNTGYFSFAALLSGANHVTCYEGNLEHARFVEQGARLAGLSHKLTMNARYFDFLQRFTEAFDVTYCLNVLHHLGDDFGDASLGVETARAQMLQCLNRMASYSRILILQLGFNWKGDVRHPLFAGGEKRALIDFVADGCAEHWLIDEVSVPHPVTRIYEPVSQHNLPRNNQIGEFMNRPLFKLRSRVIAVSAQAPL